MRGGSVDPNGYVNTATEIQPTAVKDCCHASQLETHPWSTSLGIDELPGSKSLNR